MEALEFSRMAAGVWLLSFWQRFGYIIPRERPSSFPVNLFIFLAIPPRSRHFHTGIKGRLAAKTSCDKERDGMTACEFDDDLTLGSGIDF